MSTPQSATFSRRDFMRLSAATAGASVLAASVTAPRALGATPGSDKIRVGVIGCGGRGTGAAQNCLDSSPGVEIVALADLFPRQVERAREKFKVKPEMCFTGFDCHEKLVKTDVDLVILAAPPGFRPSHFSACVAAGKHVFMEKPVAVDPVGVRQVIADSKLAKEKRLGVGVGTQRRHQFSYIEVMKRIHGGDIGELVGGQCYWNGENIWFRKKEGEWLEALTDFEWQCWNWYHWDWICGDHIVEQHIHNIDVMNWAYGGPPVSFVGMGGRQNRGALPGNIWDNFSVEMVYGNGARVASYCRHAPKTMTRVSERVVGTKGTSDPSGTILGAKPYTYAGPQINPLVQEHTDLIKSIRDNAPINDGVRVAESTLTAIGGRIAAYTGREISWNWLMNGSKLDIFPKNPAPGPGLYGPVPIPGTVPLV